MGNFYNLTMKNLLSTFMGFKALLVSFCTQFANIGLFCTNHIISFSSSLFFVAFFALFFPFCKAFMLTSHSSLHALIQLMTHIEKKL
jgi:hypothetical protein